jgi:hypothetical protein
MSGRGCLRVAPARARHLTLAWVNRVRAVHQLGRPLSRLPAGWGGASGCPIAVALSDDEECRFYATVGEQSACVRLVGAPNISLELPQAARAFVSWFDAGAYGELQRTG